MRSNRAPKRLDPPVVGLVERHCSCGASVMAMPATGWLEGVPVLCDGCQARLDAEERQREAEVNAQREATRHERLRTAAEIPAALAALTYEHCKDLAETAITAARRWVNANDGLLLTGDVGLGKTHLAAAAANDRLAHGKPVRWVSAPMLMAMLGSGLASETRERGLALLTDATALVLDDIDKARPTEYGAEQIFCAVDQRVVSKTPLLVTTNLAPSELADRWPELYGHAIVSRLVGYCRVVKLTGHDLRLSHAGG